MGSVGEEGMIYGSASELANALSEPVETFCKDATVAMDHRFSVTYGLVEIAKAIQSLADAMRDFGKMPQPEGPEERPEA